MAEALGENEDALAAYQKEYPGGGSQSKEIAKMLRSEDQDYYEKWPKNNSILYAMAEAITGKIKE